MNKKTVGRVIQEENEVTKIYAQITEDRLWDTKFQMPLNGKISSPFGRYRLYSSHMRRRIHWGVDFRAPVGKTVRACAGGRVVLAKSLYFGGKTVIINHGYGLLTAYEHLKSLRVKEGDSVTEDQVIGKSGMTGKTTGPHLHWQAVLYQVKINPLALSKISSFLGAEASD